MQLVREEKVVMDMSLEGEEEGGGVIRRAEIDTRAPFRSVKEAVMLFGERVLAGEVYANKLNQMRAAAMKDEQTTSRLGSIFTELEETKENLEKAREESLAMVNHLISLQEELEKTKMELKQLKAKEPEKQVPFEPEMEDIKFVENATEIEIKIETPTIRQEIEFQKKRSVKFANPPTLARVMSTDQDQVLERQFYPTVDRTSETTQANKKKKKKKKQLIPLIASMFSKKKGYQDGSSRKARSSRTLVQSA